MNIINRILQFSIILLVVGCSGILNMTPQEPQVLKTVTDVSIKKNDSVEIDMSFVQAYDVNEDSMSVTVLSGENYTVNGNMVIPDLDFVGDLHVNIQVKDEGGLLSKVETVIISILPDLLEITPIYDGANWLFADTFFTIDSATTSELEVTGLYSNSVAGITGETYVMNWLNIDSLSLNYLYHSSDSGSVRVGGNSLSDTLISPELKLKYPVNIGDTWKFSPLKYDVTIGKYYEDSRVNLMKCNSIDVYVTVPAGTFKCIEYEYSYPYTPSRFINNKSVSYDYEEIINRSAVKLSQKSQRADVVTVKLFYALGVGYVQNLTYLNSTLVIKKVLVDYTVEEKN